MPLSAYAYVYLQANADPLIRNRFGYMPLDVAVMNNKPGTTILCSQCPLQVHHKKSNELICSLPTCLKFVLVPTRELLYNTL